jgi:hypothetical protein
MTRTLLILVAAGAVVCVLSLSVLHAIGGLNPLHKHFKIDFDDDGHGSSADSTVITRDMAWPGGDSLHISVPATVNYTQGPQVKFTVSGPKAVIDSLRMDDGDLVKADGAHWRHDGHLTVTVTSPSTHDFELSGAQEMTIKNYDQDSLDLHIAGAAQVTGEGRAKRLDAHIAGAGQINLGQMPVDDATVSISGAGDATLDPKVSADIDISGAGHVDLKTKPPTLHTHIAGFGTVDHP